MVVHSNHPQELCHQTEIIFNKLRHHNVTLLNQSVLLKDINDNVEILVELNQKLFAQGVMPYYLHLLDKVEGASHFEITKQNAKQLHIKLQSLLPGYLVPKLVHELAGAKNKIII